MRWVPRQKNDVWGVSWRETSAPLARATAVTCVTEGGSAGARVLQQPEQLEQQQRAWTALRNPRRWVARCARFAGMESKVANPVPDVNSMTDLAAVIHLIRLLRTANGLCVVGHGHKGLRPCSYASPCLLTPGPRHLVASVPRRPDRTVIQIASVAGAATRSRFGTSFLMGGLGRALGREGGGAGGGEGGGAVRAGHGMCQVFGDLNTFRIALVPQSEYPAR
jgi:hypothetical protein